MAGSERRPSSAAAPLFTGSAVSELAGSAVSELAGSAVSVLAGSAVSARSLRTIELYVR
jgi:hypothetical protein